MFTNFVSVIKPNEVILYREVITVCCENRTTHILMLCGQMHSFNVKAGGTYSNHWALDS